MNATRAEVTRFLDHDLLPQIRTELEKISTGDRAGLETELAKAIAAARAAGFSAEQAEQSPKVKELRAQLAATVDVSALENEVLSDLANFFRRYYQSGDFLALRRYMAGVYAIPYEGEEVKLHWAMHLDDIEAEDAPRVGQYLAKIKVNRFVLAAMEAGADGYLLKESGTQRIVDAIPSILNGGTVFDPVATRDVLRNLQTGGGVNPLNALAAREWRVLAEVAQGKTDKEVAVALDLMTKTARNYLDRIFTKFNVHTRTEAALLYARFGQKTRKLEHPRESRVQRPTLDSQP